MIRQFSILILASFLAGCGHEQLKLQSVNQQAAFKAALPYPFLDWKVITTTSNRGEKTMSTLFGNDIAVGAARDKRPYPPRAVIALATWHQSDNPRWFGSRVPGAPQRVEFVEFTSEKPSYRAYSEPSFQQSIATDATDRIAELAQMKAVALP